MLTDKFRFKAMDSIGAADAENDDFLQKCFVDTGYLEVLADHKDRRRIILGRTGSGKSALIVKLKEEHERVVQIKPESLALSYVSNSTILRFLIEVGVKLDIFFRLLWRHVFVVELLQYRFDLQDEEVTRNFFFRFKENKPDKKYQEALDYLEKWGSSFWKETDYRIREVTSNLESKVDAEIKASIPGFKAQSGASLNLKDEQKAEILHRAQHVVDQVQIRELGEVIELLDVLLDDDQKQYYLVVDQLDEDWVEDFIRNRLVRSLIETTRDFNRVRNAKIIIALREDLMYRVFEETRSQGFQQEKYESLVLKINWKKEQITEILDSRVQELVRRRYTKAPVKLREILPSSINRHFDPVDFLIDRTLMRPRDAIAFLNLAIKRADRKASLNATILKDAEREHSEKRLEALCDEWFADYPNLKSATKELLKGKKESFKVEDISIDDCMTYCFSLHSLENHVLDMKGKIYQLAQQHWESETEIEKFRNEIVVIFYKVGICGLKLDTHEPFTFISSDSRDIWNPDVSANTRVEIHKVFWSVLNIRPHKN